MHAEIWAHRGSSHTFIENSMAAFKQAVKDDADGVELDVQRTSDGTLAVFHDENLKRLTGLDKHLWEVSWSQLQSLTIGETSEKIPRLEEVLDFFKGTDLTVNIELKNSLYFYEGLEQEVFEVVKACQMEEQVLYSSFNHESMRRMVQMAGSERCAILTSDIQVDPWKYMSRLGVSSYHPMINSLQDKDLIQKMQENHFKVNVWTADQPAHIYAALLLGVDAIITNEPKKAVELRRQFHSDGGRQALDVVKELGLSL